MGVFKRYGLKFKREAKEAENMQKSFYIQKMGNKTKFVQNLNQTFTDFTDFTSKDKF